MDKLSKVEDIPADVTSAFFEEVSADPEAMLLYIANWAREAALADLLPAGGKWFPLNGGIQWQGELYFPADYVLSRNDIRAIESGARSVALQEAASAICDYWNACSELVVSNNGARLAFEAIAASIAADGSND